MRPDGRHVAEALAAYARAEHMTQVVVSHSPRPRWLRLGRGHVGDHVLRLLPDLDVHVIAERQS